MTERPEHPAPCGGYWDMVEGSATFGRWVCPDCQLATWQLSCNQQQQGPSEPGDDD